MCFLTTIKDNIGSCLNPNDEERRDVTRRDATWRDRPKFQPKKMTDRIRCSRHEPSQMSSRRNGFFGCQMIFRRRTLQHKFALYICYMSRESDYMGSCDMTIGPHVRSLYISYTATPQYHGRRS